MIGLAINVIIRFLVQDHPKQSEQANNLIKKMIQAGEILRINPITLCEVVWVLERSYNVSRKDLSRILKQLLETNAIEIEKDDLVREALYDFERKNNVGFADCLIGRYNVFQNCSTTYTFDLDATKQLPNLFKAAP